MKKKKKEFKIPRGGKRSCEVESTLAAFRAFSIFLLNIKLERRQMDEFTSKDVFTCVFAAVVTVTNVDTDRLHTGSGEEKG